MGQEEVVPVPMSQDLDVTCGFWIVTFDFWIFTCEILDFTCAFRTFTCD